MHRLRSKIVLIAWLSIILGSSLSAQRPSASYVAGDWIAYEEGLNAVIVKLYTKRGKLYGMIQNLFGDFPARCSICKGSRHNRRIIGMRIIRGLTWSKGRWRGKVLYPTEDKWYPCSLWRHGSKLMVEVCTMGQCRQREIKRYRPRRDV